MNDIMKRDMDVEIMSKASQFFAEGKMFVHPSEKRPLNQAEIFSIVEYGRELGIEPVIALQNIVPVKGRLCTSASVMLGLAVQVGVRYQMLSEEENGCSIRFERGHSVGDEWVIDTTYISKFDINDAKQAGLLGKDNWKNYPKAMYKARAIANGCRYVIPDKLAGLYLPEELTDVRTPSTTPGNPIHVMIDQDNDTASVVEPVKQHNPVEGGTITDKQKNKIHAMFGAHGINVYENIFKEYLYEIGIIHEDRKVGGLSKVEASHLIEMLQPESPSLMINFYYEDKYHDELKEAFSKASKAARVKLLLNMAPLIEDLKSLPKKITDELTDQQTYDYFSLFLRAIHNEEDNRRQGGNKNIVNDAVKLFDASVVATQGTNVLGVEMHPIIVSEEEDKYEFDTLSF